MTAKIQVFKINLPGNKFHDHLFQPSFYGEDETGNATVTGQVSIRYAFGFQDVEATFPLSVLELYAEGY